MNDHFDNPTVFGNILRKESIDGAPPREFVYEDEHCVVFWSNAPRARIHLLLIPRKHIVGLQSITAEDAPLLGHLQWVAHQMAAKFDLLEDGFRLLTNACAGGGQTVFHLHYHLFSGDFKFIAKD